MYHLSKLRGSPWKWLALVGLTIGLLGSMLVPPVPVSANQTVTCDDGGGGVNGYAPGSECAQLIQTYNCAHSDTPNGPIDTLTCAIPIPTPTPAPPTPAPPTAVPPTPVPPTPTPVPQM